MADREQTRRKCRVLIVENYDGLGTFLASALKDAGYHAAVAENGMQARSLAVRNIDVALVDAVLPGESGTSLAEFFSANAVPVVMMSGDQRVIENAGACRYPFLAKPFSIARLKATLKDVIAAQPAAPGEVASFDI